MANPKRIRMSRQHAWRPENPAAIRVDRTTEWGNPFPVVAGDRAAAVTRFRTHALDVHPFTAKHIRAELAGHDLACWCPLDGPCHADVLLAIANRPLFAEGGSVAPVNIITTSATGIDLKKFIVPTAGELDAIAMRISPAEEEVRLHNIARYNQLQLLRRGQPNTYNETRYR